ncbi:radical SAM protein, partial [Chloroflexota bacterium]
MSRKNTADPKNRLSRETGTIRKDWGGRLPIALVYPNSYYVGMSSLGIHAIYSLLNGYPDIVCERLFLEKGDKAPLLSLESGRKLADFAVVAFSVSYELDYFNTVKILKESGIPLYAADRDEHHPLVIAGGPCITANPMPLSPFFDCLCIGEAEVILPRILDTLKLGLDGRSEIIGEFAALPGIYAPQIDNRTPVVRQWVNDLDS